MSSRHEVSTETDTLIHQKNEKKDKRQTQRSLYRLTEIKSTLAERDLKKKPGRLHTINYNASMMCSIYYVSTSVGNQGKGQRSKKTDYPQTNKKQGKKPVHRPEEGTNQVAHAVRQQLLVVVDGVAVLPRHELGHGDGQRVRHHRDDQRAW